jgi:hypothetical protein
MGSIFGSEFYVLVLDGERIYASHSRIMCVTRAMQVIKTDQDSKELHMIRELPVNHRRDTVVYTWQRKASKWRIAPAARAV